MEICKRSDEVDIVHPIKAVADETETYLST